MGSIVVARRAGPKPAASATTSRNSIAAPSVTGSDGDSPKSCDCTWRVSEERARRGRRRRRRRHHRHLAQHQPQHPRRAPRRAPCGCRSRACAAPRRTTSRRRGRSAASSVASAPNATDSTATIRSTNSDSPTCAVHRLHVEDRQVRVEALHGLAHGDAPRRPASPRGAHVEGELRDRSRPARRGCRRTAPAPRAAAALRSRWTTPTISMSVALPRPKPMRRPIGFVAAEVSTSPSSR